MPSALFVTLRAPASDIRGLAKDAGARAEGRDSDLFPRPENHAVRARCGWILLASVLLFAAMAAPFFAGMLYAADDLWAFHLPVRAFYANCLAQGMSFDWMPQLYSGFYLTGEGQGGVYHPLHLALYTALPLRTAFDLELLTPYPLLYLGTFLFLRRRLRRADAALFGAMCFTFGSFSLLHFVHPNAMAIVAHLPWLLWLVDVAVTSPTPRSRILAEAGVSLTIGSALLLGYPQYVWFALVAVGLFALWLTRQKAELTTPGALPRLIAFLAMGGMLGAIQLLPTYDALAQSTRHAADAAFANTGALHPANLAQTVAPYALQTRVFGDNTHELTCYLGAVPLALLVWLMGSRQQLSRRYRKLALAAAGLCVLSLILCLGQAGLLYAVQMKLPVVGRFRLPARYLVLVNFGASVLAAIAFATLTRNRRGTAAAEPAPSTFTVLRTSFSGLIAASLVVSLAMFVIWRTDRAAALPLVIVGPGLLATAAWLVSATANRARWAFPLLVLFAAADLGAYGLSYAIWPGAATPDQANAALAATLPNNNTGRINASRIVVDPQVIDPETGAKPGLRSGNQAVLAGAKLADGYAGLEPADGVALGSLPALRLAGVTHVANRGGNNTIAGLIPTADSRWLRVPEPLPRVRLVSQAIKTSNDQRETLLPTHDPADVALLDETLAGAPLELSGPPGAARREVDEPGHIRVAVNAPARQLLIVNERFHPGWQVTVDGLPRDVLRAYGTYLACVVDEDARQVEFTFAPASLRWGKWISAIALALLISLTCARLVRTGEPRSETDSPNINSPIA